ncbi:MAG: hypothetical protein ACU0CY_04800 [Maritimibacter harenae]
MTFMHKMALPLTLGFALTAGAATAQGMFFSQIDADNDATLSYGELEMAFGAQADAALAMYDVNDDGLIERSEALDVQQRGEAQASTATVTEEQEDSDDMASNDTVSAGASASAQVDLQTN